MTQTFQNLIAGEWRDGDGTIENRSPSDVTDLIGRYAQAGKADLDRAVEAARDGGREWRKVGLEQRQACLMTIGEELMRRSAELGELLSREEGKPLAEGKGEVYRAGQFFTYYAAEVLRQLGENADSVRPGIEIDIRREPMGIVAVGKFQGDMTPTMPIGSRRISISMPGRTESAFSPSWRSTSAA